MMLDQFFAFFMIAVALGLVPAGIAYAKGRDFLTWWVYGAALFVIATPHAFTLISDRRALDLRKIEEGYAYCPSCAELVREGATVCRYCRGSLAKA